MDKNVVKNEDLVTIPLACHENDMEREDRKHKRLWILILVLIVALVGSNVGWIYYESQWEDVVTETNTQTITQDSGDGGSNTYNGDFLGGDYIGETNSN